MEFKRVFTKIRSAMKEFIQIGPVMWVAVSTDLPGKPGYYTCDKMNLTLKA